MKRIAAAIACSWALSIPVWADGPQADGEKFWPQWRGPRATGVAPQGSPPVEWSESRNVRWKVELPGLGNATPIIWGDRVYIQTAIETDKPADPEQAADPQPQQDSGRRRRGHWGSSPKPTKVYEFVVLALDRRDGSVRWRHTVCQAVPHEGGHRDSTQASNSPVTDGRHLITYFGSRGLYCFDMEGSLLWERNLGEMTTRNSFGEGSSPALHGDTVVVNWDHQGDSFIVALDKKTGRQLWKVDRDEVTSWATPLIVNADGRSQVVTSATKHIRSYDLATGDLIWQGSGMTMNVIPSPVFGRGTVYVLSGFRGNALQAIHLAGARGDITDSKSVAWTHDKNTPYVPSPLLYDDKLYFLKTNSGILSCFNAETGEPHYARQRLEGLDDVFSSPVGAAGRVYIVGKNGTTAVIKHGPSYEVLATN